MPQRQCQKHKYQEYKRNSICIRCKQTSLYGAHCTICKEKARLSYHKNKSRTGFTIRGKPRVYLCLCCNREIKNKVISAKYCLTCAAYIRRCFNFLYSKNKQITTKQIIKQMQHG